MGTAKQLRTDKLGFDKIESKTGRPPTRKLEDRKAACTRQKHTTVNTAVDFPAYAFSSSFWRKIEPLFDFISDVDMAFLKQQPDLAQTGDEEISRDICRL